MHLDRNGSIIAVFDNNGHKVCEYTYGPFGNILKKKEEILPPLYFQSFYLIKDLNLYIDRDKFYMPEFFIALQPVKFLYNFFKPDYSIPVIARNTFPEISPASKPEQINIKRYEPFKTNGIINEFSISNEFSWIKLFPGKEHNILFKIYRSLLQ